MQASTIDIPILRTKLFLPPARPDVVNRPRLLARLDEDPTRTLTLISAPAGFGKTTLLRAWQSRTLCSLSWFSLDTDDNDPRRFWSYFINAIQGMRPGIGKDALALLNSRLLQPFSHQFLLTSVLNELSTIQDPIIIALDDYHLIQNPAIHDSVHFLLDHQPVHMHLMILTRADPPLPLGRLRARNQLTEIRAADLSFTVAEASQFFNQSMGLGLSQPEILALAERTEGWITGLQLAYLYKVADQPVNF